MSDYERLQRLGEGNYGEVWLVFDRALAVNRAVKYVTPSRIKDPTNFYNEPHTLMALQHDYIVRVEDAGKTPEGTLYIAMEYLPRGSVEDVYKGAPVPITIAFKILMDICWALEYAHQEDYIHRDIKPANILLTKEGTAKLSDFGLATKVPRGVTASAYGYLTHVAPEVLRTAKTSKASDVYALGVTAYRLINGDGYLPEVSDLGEIQDMILDEKYPDRTHYRPYIPQKIKNIVNKCRSIDSSDRFQSASDFRKALEGVTIHCDWLLRRKGRVINYLAKIGTASLKVTIKPLKNDRFDIRTTKRIGGGNERNINKDSFSNLTLLQMKKRIRQILPRYVRKGH